MSLLQYRPIMMGDMTSDGSLTAMYLDNFGNWRVKCNVQVRLQRYIILCVVCDVPTE